VTGSSHSGGAGHVVEHQGAKAHRGLAVADGQETSLRLTGQKYPLSPPGSRFLLRGRDCHTMRPCPPLGVDELADAVPDPDPSRRASPPLEDALGQVPRFPFIAEDIAPRPPGGADAVIGDFHHPDAEEIGPGLHAVVPRAVAGGIAGFEDDAEVEHGLGKETVYLYANQNANRFPCVLRSRKP